jgi:hypothetical protein
MLESFFTYPGVLGRMRRGPLADHIDGLAADLERTRYSRTSVKRYLSLVATFSRYAAQVGCLRGEDVDTPLIERCLGQVPTSAGTRAQAKTAIGHVMRRLGCGERAAARPGVHESDVPSSRASRPTCAMSEDCAAGLARMCSDSYGACWRGIGSSDRDSPLRRLEARRCWPLSRGSRRPVSRAVPDRAPSHTCGTSCATSAGRASLTPISRRSCPGSRVGVWRGSLRISSGRRSAP